MAASRVTAFGSRVSKYGNRKVEIDGERFDSAAEAERYQALKTLALRGAISDLRVHPEYILLDAFHNPWTGERVRAIVYELDFDYVENGRTVAVDVKGYATKDNLIKRKLFLARYPDIKLEIVKVEGRSKRR